MQKENINQLTSSRSVGMRDINTALSAPISRIKTLRDDEGRGVNVGQVLPDNKGRSCPPCGESAPLGAKGGLIKRAFFAPPSALQATSCAREEGNSGFTLIELLVVVLIIGILAAIAISQYQSVVDKSRIIGLAAYAKSIENAQHLYFLANGEYADTLEKLNIPPINSAVEVRPSYNPNRLHIFGGTYLPDILLIYDYGNYRRCLAKDTNARAQAACLRLCNPRSAWLDGPWRVCNVL